jgi:hypothetical protein
VASDQYDVGLAAQARQFLRELEPDARQEVADCLLSELGIAGLTAELKGKKGPFYRKLVSCGYWILFSWITREEGARRGRTAFVMEITPFWSR